MTKLASPDALALDLPVPDDIQPEFLRPLTAADSAPGAVHWPTTQPPADSQGCCGAPCSGGGCRSERATG